MPLCFRNFVPYVLPGVLALLGCWWIYSRRKKHGTYREEQAVAAEEQQEEVTEQDRTAPETEPCVLQRRLSMLEEEHTENKTSTCLLTVGLRVPSNCHTDERLDLSAHLPVTTDEPSSLENDSEKLEETESQDTKSGPACVSLPWESAWLEQPGEEDVSGSVASTVPVCQGEEDTQLEGDELRREKVREVSLCKEDVEKIAQVTIQIVSKVILAATEEVLSGAASDGSTQICQAAASRVQTLLDMAGVSSDQMLAEEAPVAGENVKSDAVVPTSLQAKEQGQNVTHSSCLIRGSSSGPEEGDTKDCWKKNPVCSEGELPAPPGDGSTQLCQAGVSQAETPLEMASAVSTDQTLAEEAPVADTNTAGMNDAVVLTSPQTEEQDQDVTCSSCITQSPTEGATTDCHMKTPVCSKSQGGGRTPVENHKGSPEKPPLVREGSVCSTSTCEGGACVEGPLQSTMLAVASGQHSELLSLSATQDASAGQSSGPSETQPTLKLSEDNEVPCSNKVLREDGPDPANECNKAPGIDGDCPQGLNEHGTDVVNSGCVMKKAVTQQNTKTGGETSKCDHIIWEIEVPKELVGRLIGRQGKFMSFLRQKSGAKIYVSTKPYFRDSQVCHIEGFPHQVEKVLSLIGMNFKELCLTNIHGVLPPAPLTINSVLMTAWLFLPEGVNVEVVMAHQVDAGHMFLQQHTHPTFHVLRSLDQQMCICYSQPEIPTLPTPVEVGIICAAPGLDGAWLRAQVISYFEETSEVELRYVDYGGYDKVKVDTVRQIRSDFLSLPFQAAEVLLDNVVPLAEDYFSPEADAAVGEMTIGAVLVAQVTNYDSATGLPLIQLWNLMGDEVVSINRTLVEKGLARSLDY
ncbi:A-kinase anchor protein 1, mitochondrial isoform X2 [Melopsittacus undulatus]|uniref:A-kinase anchor protein 1, mitochondrial isoform X2 n=1 Tax=Melopsittacus undulatus TaxID=13146 RepID=UPI00146F1F46|nr:A-kinase anchor protein 1, mitochondrial isoform X2 [Melopsittacus undulatus]